MQWELGSYPFFDRHHHSLVDQLTALGPSITADVHGPTLRANCLTLAARMAHAGLLGIAIPDPAGSRADVRALCLVREALAYHSGLADAVFAMQGIGTAPLWNLDSRLIQEKYVAPCRDGRALAAFAITERDAGSDIAAIKTSARQDGDNYILSGEKAWISNAGIADHYIIVARTGEAEGAKGLSAFILDADQPGLEAGPQIENLCNHPLGDLTLHDCVVPAEALISSPGGGFAAAMAMFNIFRISVGAAALGMARRALDETLTRVSTRTLFRSPMSRLGAVEQKIADMVAEVETARLHVYQAAWRADHHDRPVPETAALAKLTATEAAFGVIDQAVQLFGALGVIQGTKVEELYRDIRPLRIYEGASEIQKIIIARSALRNLNKTGRA